MDDEDIGGSLSNTSIAAPPISPLFNAAAKALLSKTGPLAVFIKRAFFSLI